MTADLVPTGINIGVSITPCGVVMVPALAKPSVASRENEKEFIRKVIEEIGCEYIESDQKSELSSFFCKKIKIMRE